MTARVATVEEQSCAPTPKPFMKWVGGKRQLLPELCKYVPARFGTYFEPFLGGGALFFHLAAQGPIRAYLNDANPFLTKTYKAVRDEPEELIRWLSAHEARYREDWPYYRDRLQCYLQMREALGTNARNGPAANVAARVIFLNRTCFNGLWRVNRKGEFNVPIGKSANCPTICDVDNLRACSRALQGVTISCGDFYNAASPKKGDLWYADPPYVPASDSANFTAYARGGFGLEDQERLRDLTLDLKRRGVHVILSNADVPIVRKLYANLFVIHRVEARRAVNSKASKRGPVGEVIIT